MAWKRPKDVIFKVLQTQISLLTALSYLFDSLFFGVLILLAMWWRRGNPRYHEFSVADESISHTYYNDLSVFVSNVTLFGVFLAVPILLTIAVFGLDPTDSPVRKLWNIYCGLLAFLAGQSIQSLIVSILKIQTGMPRPDMLQRCQPSNWDLAPLGSLNNVGICGAPNLQLIRDGFKSFPSGHATTAFASATYCFCIMSSKFQLFQTHPFTYKVIIATLPFVIALFLSASRYSDNRHFLRDLICGSSIGIQCGYWSYRYYFNALTDPTNAGMALPPRRMGTHDINKLFWRLDNDPTYHYDDKSEAMSSSLPSSTLPASNLGSPTIGGQCPMSASSPHSEFSRANQEAQRSKSAAISRPSSRRFDV